MVKSESLSRPGGEAERLWQSQGHSMHKLFDLLEATRKETEFHVTKDFVPAFLETMAGWPRETGEALRNGCFEEVASDLGIFHELEGFHYSPVERNTCVSIHCFLDAGIVYCVDVSGKERRTGYKSSSPACAMPRCCTRPT